MPFRSSIATAIAAACVAGATIVVAARDPQPAAPARGGRYEDLTSLFTEWRAFPKLLDQARVNLTGDRRDLWTYGAKSIRQQSADLAALAPRVRGAPGMLEDDVRRAREATDSFASWLDAQAPSKRGSSGVGV